MATVFVLYVSAPKTPLITNLSQRGCVQCWIPRYPMTQLPDEYRVTETNKDPPLVHFAIPISIKIIFRYAVNHNYFCSDAPHVPDVAKALESFSQYIAYQVEIRCPSRATADCGLLLALYDNYRVDAKLLIDEDQEDVIRLVQEELGLDRSKRPKWYFDWGDPWCPPDDSDESENESMSYQLQLT